MFYSQHQYRPSYNNIKHPQPQTTKLPSFNELLTSIPLPNDFLGKSGSSTSSSISSSLSNSQSSQSSISSSHFQNTPKPTPINSQHYQPQPVHYNSIKYQSLPVNYQSHSVISLPQFNSPQIPPQLGYVTYQRTSINSSVSPRTILDNGIEIPTPPPSTDSLSSPSGDKIRSMSPANSDINSSTSSSPRSINELTPRRSNESPSIAKSHKRKHVCKVCTRSFTTSGHLARHNRIHTGERKHVCPWPTCDARFARQDNCMQHYKTHTNGKNKRSKLNFKNSNLITKPIM